MTYVLVVAALVFSLAVSIRMKKKEQGEYEGYEKYDADPKWVLKHVVLIVLLLFLIVYFLFFDPGDRTVNILMSLVMSFFVATMITDILFDSNRYVYVKGNKIVFSSQTVDRRQIKGYRKNKILPGGEVVTFNSDRYKVYKQQMKVLEELSVKYKFPWKQL